MPSKFNLVALFVVLGGIVALVLGIRGTYRQFGQAIRGHGPHATKSSSSGTPAHQGIVGQEIGQALHQAQQQAQAQQG